jgi:hypothetical protein
MQRGTLELAGDFVDIPLGCAFMDIVYGGRINLSALSRWPAPPKEGSKVAVETTTELGLREKSIRDEMDLTTDVLEEPHVHAKSFHFVSKMAGKRIPK